jgi:hypothetical protein
MKQRAIVSLIAIVGVAVALMSLPASGVSSTRKAEVALARKALIVKSDFPSAWTTSSNGGNANKNLGVAQMLACLGMPASFVNYNPPEADSPTFNDNALGLTVDDSVDIFSSVKVAMEVFDLYGSPNSAKCVARAFNSTSVKAVFARGIGSGAKMGVGTVTALAKPVASNESNALELRLPFTYKGQQYVLESVDIVILSKSRTEGAELVLSGPSGSQLSPSLVKHIESVTVQRLG